MSTLSEAAILASTQDFGPGHGGGGPWFLLIPLFWIAVIVAVVAVCRSRGRGWQRHHGAEGVLRERYARGEVPEEEFRQRLEVLRGK